MITTLCIKNDLFRKELVTFQFSTSHPLADGDAPSYTDGVMADHVRIVAILHIVLSSLTIIGALVVLAVFGGIATMIGTSGSPDALPAMPIVGGIGAIICIVLIFLGVPGLIAGIGLLKFRPWARTLGIIISGLDLISVPFGTALGIYGLWVLLSKEAEMLFRDPPCQPVRV
jgi:hypothetical protein